MTKSEISKHLEMISLFKGIDGLEHAVKAFPPEEIHLSSGEKYTIKNSLALLVTGKADLIKESDNKAVYLKTVEGVTLLGLASLFATESEYISTVFTKSESTILMFSEEFVKALVESDSEFSLRLVKLLCQKVRYLNRRIDFYTCQGAEEKVHEFLLRSCDCEGEVVMSMSKLSDILGIARASLYRAVAALEEKGYIIKNGKKIKLIK